MKRILITGATGNVGSEVIRYLCDFNSDFQIIAAVRNEKSAASTFLGNSHLTFRHFDFKDDGTFDSAFKDIGILFLLRPPNISQVEKYFRPLLNSAHKNGIINIVFLSVQGADKSRVIPHNKIERLVKTLGFNYIFVRPSYFMQNLTTTFLSEIRDDKTITLPSGRAKFNWVDVKNIGEATARLILSFEKFKNDAYDITGTENKDFLEVTKLITAVTGRKITYKRINPVSFYFKKRKEGVQSGFAMVMTILHFLPRFQSEPMISAYIKILTGNEPTTLKEFIEREIVI
jgi:uncharacterized protein YbjT (DUF2867 family)